MSFENLHSPILRPKYSPATAPRQFRLRALGFSVRRYADLRLTIPVIQIPFDDAATVWLLCSVHHEVGHDIDADLKLTPEIREHFKALDGIAAERREIWERWASEVVADCFGVLLGGAGFGYFITNLLFVLQHGDFSDLQHPAPRIRSKLVKSLIERRLPANPIGVRIAHILSPDEAASKEQELECEKVADLVLMRPLTALRGHSLMELVAGPQTENCQAEELSAFLSSGAVRPSPSAFPTRLVPVAAQLAASRAENISDAEYEKIHQRALEYLEAIPRPKWLAGSERRNYLRKVAENVRFVQ